MGCGESKNTGGDTVAIAKKDIGGLMSKDAAKPDQIANVAAAANTAMKTPEVKASEQPKQPVKEAPAQQAAPRSTGSAADEQ